MVTQLTLRAPRAVMEGLATAATADFNQQDKAPREGGLGLLGLPIPPSAARRCYFASCLDHDQAGFVSRRSWATVTSQPGQARKRDRRGEEGKLKWGI